MPSANKTYIIAEMACSHEGDHDLAKFIIKSAYEAGADAIQFQVWQRELIMSPSHPDYGILESVQLTQSEWIGLVDFTRASCQGMSIIACIYETTSLDFCDASNVDAYKIHATDINNLHFLRKVGEKKKRVDLSIGACTQDEIETAITLLKDNGCPEIWLMYGLQNFPTPPKDIDLKLMMNLGAKLNVRVGFQDHTAPEDISAYTLPAAAIGLGCDVIEKHITHDRSKKGVDHQAALNPDEFVTFVKTVKDIDLTLSGGKIRDMTEAVLHYRKYSSKSRAAKADIKVGTLIDETCLKIIRTPDLGINPSLWDNIIGKKLMNPKSENEPILSSDLD